MKKIIPFWAFLLATNFMFAQHIDSTAAATQKRHEFGFDIKNVLNKTLVSAVIYKRKIEKHSEMGKAAQFWRFQFSWRGDVNNARDSSVLLVGSRNIASFANESFVGTFTVGREWVKQQWDRFSIYGGGEIFTRYFFSDATRPDLSGSSIINIGDNIRFSWNSGDNIFSQQLRLGLSPFFGAKYQLNHRFFLAAESSLDIYYESEVFKINSTPISQVEFDEVRIKNEGFGSFFAPLNMLVIGFNF